jgi:small subunit ribosomal protein S19e
MDPDWWYVRAASLLRRVALVGPIGTEKLRTHYGGRKNKGHQPERFYKASGNVIRTILKQLDKAGLTKQNEKGVKGRIVTANGQKVLYSLSDQIVAEKAKSQSS